MTGSPPPRVLLAGIGNVLLGDDGFGVEVVRHLRRGPAVSPVGVAVVDYGIRGLHLAYDLYDGYDDVVMVDALGRGQPPGTVSVVDLSDAGPPDAGPPDAGPPDAGPSDAGPSDGGDTPSEPLPVPTSAAATATATATAGAAAPGEAALDAHGMQPDAVLGLLELLGGELGRVFLVGCEPASLDHRIGLSPPVARAVRPAADVAVSLARSLVREEV